MMSDAFSPLKTRTRIEVVISTPPIRQAVVVVEIPSQLQ